ncbi:tRNA-uridine aminocarboxypropyltransferase [Moritella sp.]|uniref:tRNA-uridine aminocarboxypropyltransferase n=1 Tax=Moritella sp. TaxID=78556 RepID=UPI001D5BE9C1|nr:tRNA-uridine aminocarboxypropyltransferase [Moritella sp.]MCJ8351564.1 DTW domain-containing protein [Moritella sp.]NQZ38525.1 DTW domain-containing protein [Moritella sp.]
MRIHNVHRLAIQRLADSTKPFKARGGKLIRCDYCMLGKQFCICEHQPLVKSTAGFMLVMFDYEMIKPSNTGRLIADVIEDTFAYQWSRTEPNQEMIDIINQSCWQPFVIFPEEYVVERERVQTGPLIIEQGKRPLYILLDGSWREAKKMFKKSPWLEDIPVISFDPDVVSQYQIRKAAKDNQLATAEVASLVLGHHGEALNADILGCWFDVFRERYLSGTKQLNVGVDAALKRLQTLTV